MKFYSLVLGIETCFVNGMASYIQTWLQFACPLYIWMVIIYLSWHSTMHHSQVGGFQCSLSACYAVSPFLCQTAMNCHCCIHLPEGDGRSLIVWQYDGNVPFGNHNIWFCSWWPLLSHSSSSFHSLCYCCLHPAYKHHISRFWTDLMLVVRSTLIVGCGLNILSDPDIKPYDCDSDVNPAGMYWKNKALSILETPFILNLIILSGWTVYIRHASNGMNRLF